MHHYGHKNTGKNMGAGGNHLRRVACYIVTCRAFVLGGAGRREGRNQVDDG